MEIQQALDILNSKFVYKAETVRYVDKWRILTGNTPWTGDCEDYSLTLMWLVADKNLIRFIANLTLFKFLMWYVTAPSNEGHAVVKYKGLYYDNIQRRGVTKDKLLAQGYKFRFPMVFPYVYLKLLVSYTIGKLI